MNRATLALALNGFREARRNRVSIVVVAFALVLLLASTLVTHVTVYTMDRVLTDFGLGSMSLALVGLSIFFSSGQLAKEIERRTIFLIVSKPLSRERFLIARYAGTLITLGTMLIAMYGVFAAQILLAQRHLTLAQVEAAVGLFFELAVICSVGFFVSSFSSQFVSAVVTTGTYFAGHLSTDLYNLAELTKLDWMRDFGRVFYYLLPNLDRLNLRPNAAYELPVPFGQLLLSCGYGACYAAAMVLLAAILFARRDFK